MFTTDASQERDDYSTNRLSARGVSNCDFSPAVYAIFVFWMMRSAIGPMNSVPLEAFCHSYCIGISLCSKVPSPNSAARRAEQPHDLNPPNMQLWYGYKCEL